MITLPTVRKWLKHIVAMTLFIAILLGGSAAAFSLLAAGISGLSAMDHRGSATASAPVTAQASGSATAATTATAGVSGNSSVLSTAAPDAVDTVPPQTAMDEINHRLDRMHSPLGSVVDTGGVVIGNQVGQAFGRLLAGLIQTLFVEQPDRGGSSPQIQ